MNKKEIKDLENKAERQDPGVQIDVADNEKVSAQMVKDRVKMQNNNPRNNDMY